VKDPVKISGEVEGLRPAMGAVIAHIADVEQVIQKTEVTFT